MVLSLLVRSKPSAGYELAGLAAREHVDSRNLQWLGSVDLPGDGWRPLYLRAGAPRIGGFRSSRRQGSFSGIVGA